MVSLLSPNLSAYLDLAPRHQAFINMVALPVVGGLIVVSIAEKKANGAFPKALTIDGDVASVVVIGDP